MILGTQHAKGLQDDAQARSTGKSVPTHFANLIAIGNWAGVFFDTKVFIIIDGLP